MNRLITGLLLLTFITVGCSTQNETPSKSGSQSAKRGDITAIANDTSKDIARVTQVSDGKNGAPIIVLEEQHDSRAAQIELAIVLNRLYHSQNLRHIVLEGYLKEDPAINTDWYERAGKNKQSVHSVAVRLLEEGEINSAEFIKLAYHDSLVIPAETQAEYPYDVPDEREIAVTCVSYLYQLALKSPNPEMSAKLTRMMSEVERLEADPIAREAKLKAIREFIGGKKPSEISDDPWIKEATAYFTEPERAANAHIEAEIAIYEELQKRIAGASVEKDPKQEADVEKFLAFLRKRSTASNTMVTVAASIADRADTPAVAMIIGAAHTSKVSQLLQAAGRPFAVVRPLVLDASADLSSIPLTMYERKRKRLSIYSEGIAKTLLQSFPRSIKPPPVVQQQWFEAKAELYLFTDRIAEAVLGDWSGGGAGPPPNLQPPFGFGDDEFKGKSVYIDPNKISVVPDGETGKRYAVLFPVSLNRDDPVLHQTVWVKAVRSEHGAPAVNERDDVETMLKASLHVVEGSEQSKKPDVAKQADGTNGKRPELLLEKSTMAEDKVGRIKITRATVAAFATSEQAARRCVVSKL